MTRREMARRRRLRAVQARMLLASRHEDCARVSQLMGGEMLMAAYTLLDHDCDVERCCAFIEKQILKLARELMDDAKQRTPIDTGALRASARSSRTA